VIAAYHLRAPALFAYGTGLSKRTASLSSCAYIVPFSSHACAGAKSSAWWRSAVASKASCVMRVHSPRVTAPMAQCFAMAPSAVSPMSTTPRSWQDRLVSSSVFLPFTTSRARWASRRMILRGCHAEWEGAQALHGRWEARAWVRCTECWGRNGNACNGNGQVCSGMQW
jgi:hypothetical protein